MEDSKGLRVAIAVCFGICCLPLMIVAIVLRFIGDIIEWVKDVVDFLRDMFESFANWCNEPCKEETIESEENAVLDEEEIEEP